MGHVADRWHLSRPGPDDVVACEHRGRVPSTNHGKGKRWQARYDGPDGRERTALFATRAEADRFVVQQENAKQTGSWLDPAAGKVTVRAFALESWLPAQNINPRTRAEYLGALERYVFPEWGTRQMRSIRPSEAGAWQQSLTAVYGLSGQYPNRVARIVRGMFKLAVVDRVIALSPFDGIKAPTLLEAAVHPPDVAEVLALVQHAYNDRWRTMLEVAALTGLRSGELRGLALDRIDFLRRTVRVDQQLVYTKGAGMHLDTVKTSSARRTVPLPQRVVDVLAAYVRQYPPAAEGDWAGLVFTMPGGRPIGTATLDWALKAICEKASVRPRHWHELRHHYASVLIAGGESVKVVQKRLGHKNVTTTLSTYAHLFAEAEERTRDVLDAAWGSQRDRGGEEFPQQSGRMAEDGATIVEFPQVSG